MFIAAVWSVPLWKVTKYIYFWGTCASQHGKWTVDFSSVTATQSTLTTLHSSIHTVVARPPAPYEHHRPSDKWTGRPCWGDDLWWRLGSQATLIIFRLGIWTHPNHLHAAATSLYLYVHDPEHSPLHVMEYLTVLPSGSEFFHLCSCFRLHCIVLLATCCIHEQLSLWTFDRQPHSKSFHTQALAWSSWLPAVSLFFLNRNIHTTCSRIKSNGSLGVSAVFDVAFFFSFLLHYKPYSQRRSGGVKYCTSSKLWHPLLVKGCHKIICLNPVLFLEVFWKNRCVYICNKAKHLGLWQVWKPRNTNSMIKKQNRVDHMRHVLLIYSWTYTYSYWVH